jgi:uncharacterized protein YciI
MLRSARRRPVLPAALMFALVLLPAASPAQNGAKKSGDGVEQPAPVAKGRLFAVVLGPGQAWKKGQPFKGPGLEQHRAYWKRLHAQGHVASAGPLGGDTGLALVRARNQREADALLAGDPAVRLKILHGVARPYAAELVRTEVLAGR